ncbi:MAG: CNNM domain-containing protein [Armatimonas sp.]
MLLNGVFSMSETAVISAKRARLQQRAEAGDDRATTVLDLIAQPDRFLSTVQIGITLIGVVSGAIGESTLGVPLSHGFERLGLSKSLSQTLGVSLGLVIITYLSLVLGELVPKTLALNNPENISTRVAGPMRLLSESGYAARVATLSLHDRPLAPHGNQALR